MPSKYPLISIVIPCHNEAGNIAPLLDLFHGHLNWKNFKYELIFVDDGSQDSTVEAILKHMKNNAHIKLYELSKNFGKEAATTAGIRSATGDAVVVVDADGQHPINLIPDFIQKWEEGAQVVVGVRRTNKNEGSIKKYGSKLFYMLFNKFTESKLVPGSTDFRLIDKVVQQEFNCLKEKNRITRGLIDWLGFEKSYIYFDANPRIHGEASYTTNKLIKLAVNTFVTLSFKPLFMMGYFGLAISVLSLVAGLLLVVEDLILKDPFGLNVTGSGYLGVMLVFLVGMLLVSQGLISIYISHIHEEVRNRPLYIFKNKP